MLHLPQRGIAYAQATIGAHDLQIATVEGSLLDPDRELIDLSHLVISVTNLDAEMTIDLDAHHRLMAIVNEMTSEGIAVQIDTSMVDAPGRGRHLAEMVSATGAQRHPLTKKRHCRLPADSRKMFRMYS
jgi:hypothetical protein